MSELLNLSLAELTTRLRKRKASPVELMSEVLERIEATRDELNAVVAVRDADDLMAEAKASEKRLAKGEGGALEGVPFGVKDLEDVGGMVTTFGSLPFVDNVAQQDSTQVARLKQAGAIVVGKTNTPEFGFTAITKNLVFGATRSPWDRERTPGGSSGGSAAALTGGVLPLVTSSDGGGSIRIPASFTGAFGLKTSHGRVPRGPLPDWDYVAASVYGPLTRTVEDAALFLDQVAGPSPCDPYSLPHPGVSYQKLLEQPLEGSLRIAFSPELGYAAVQDDYAAVVEEAAKVFEKLGHRLEQVEGGPPDLTRMWGLVGRFQQASVLRDVIREQKDKMTRSYVRGLEKAWDMKPEEWGEAAQDRVALNDWCADLFGTYDLLVTPTVPYDPPPARGPFPSEIGGKKLPPVGVAAFTIPFNLSWHPAATVRAGLSEIGMPVGLQIVGPRHRDDLVLQASRAFERERPWHPHWP